MPRRNFLLRLAYDGSGFSGWQRQPEPFRTVQAEVEASLSRVLGEAIEVTGAGRTDAGVHAEAQGASFHSRTALSCEAIAEALGRELPPDIACTECREVDPRFHARFRAKSKTYRYRFILAAAGGEAAGAPAADRPGALAGRRAAFVVAAPLDLGAMAAAAALFVGEHDFRAFTNAEEAGDRRRKIDDARVHAAGDRIDFVVTARGFLTNQVRIMASAVLEAGRGRLGAGEIRRLLEGAERSSAPGMLPPQGLCLVDVRF
ncbi:MAG: tRNA pseudouridine(38-40) synthase TruA [Treponema sp.]|nr:tRNA pseudouridine(38-40) synthase TruA [Treponema sp.]